MTEEQCAESYNILLDRLRDLKFDWVVQQIEADIRVGILIEKPIREISARHAAEAIGFEVIEPTEPQRRGRSGSIKQRVEYSDRQRLRHIDRGDRTRNSSHDRSARGDAQINE